MQDILFLIGFIIAITILVRIVYRIIVSGFKSYFHDLIHAITEVTGREKNIFYKINSYTLIVFGLLAPIILFAYPKFVDRFPDEFESSENFLLHVIALLIYLAAMLGGFYHVILIFLSLFFTRYGNRGRIKKDSNDMHEDFIKYIQEQDADVKRKQLIKMFRNSTCLCLMLLLLTIPVFASDSKSDQSITKSTEFSINQVLDDVYALVDTEGVKLFKEKNKEMDKELKELFDSSIIRSKLEQFYTMLYYISRYATIEKDEFDINRDLTIKLLISSKVFTDREFPKNISNVFLSRKNREKPFYKVSFSNDRVVLDLKNGRHGYVIFREGMLQQAKALVFYGSFSFRLRKKGENVEAFDFEDVDLYGSFGSRGFINVDINYVSVRSVEFHKGSEMALVRAKVSRNEFEINEHTWLLDLVTRFITDKSLQPLDW